MEPITKTLRFWLADIAEEDFQLLHELSRALADAHQEFVWAALQHVRAGGKPNNDCLREARRAYQAAFGATRFVKRFGNSYSGQVAYKDFKRQMGLIRTGQKASVSFGPGSHANIDLLTCASGAQGRLEEQGGKWLLTEAALVKGEPKADRLKRRWTLIPQTNRGKKARGRQAARTMEQMNRALTRNMVRLVWRPKRGWEAQVVVTLEPRVAKAAEDLVCGIDIGMRHLLVASIPTEAKQWWFGEKNSRELWKAIESSENQRRRLNRAGKKRAARKQGDKTARKRQHIVELASRQLVDWMMIHRVTTLRMEALTGMRERASKNGDPRWNRMLHTWPWYRLQQRIEQKCAEVGIAVELIDPQNTSATCSRCGHTDGDSRTGVEFECARCGYQQHADLNAANNIAMGGVVNLESRIESGSVAALSRRPKARPETTRAERCEQYALPTL